MPNWVKTIVKTKPDVLKDILKKYSNEDGFSFEKVIPMPKELDVERGSRGQDGLMYLFLENDNGISKEKINQVFLSLNPFNSDIYKEKRFKMVEEKFNENKNEKEYVKVLNSPNNIFLIITNMVMQIGIIGVVITGEQSGI